MPQSAPGIEWAADEMGANSLGQTAPRFKGRGWRPRGEARRLGILEVEPPRIRMNFLCPFLFATCYVCHYNSEMPVSNSMIRRGAAHVARSARAEDWKPYFIVRDTAATTNSSFPGSNVCRASPTRGGSKRVLKSSTADCNGAAQRRARKAPRATGLHPRRTVYQRDRRPLACCVLRQAALPPGNVGKAVNFQRIFRPNLDR